VWFQGCSIRCPQCISADTWGFGRGETTVEILVDSIRPWLSIADGMTVSGGEPFDQREALRALLLAVRESMGDILVYSGYAWEQLTPDFDRFHGLIDILISDPFDPTAGQTGFLRGSDNQRIHLLTERGRERYAALQSGKQGSQSPALDLVIDEHGDAWFAGIPRLGDIPRLKELLEDDGFSAVITQAVKKP
jgi:anaerobic ribonucleoside-triphosphate reductase activating protein